MIALFQVSVRILVDLSQSLVVGQGEQLSSRNVLRNLVLHNISRKLDLVKNTYLLTSKDQGSQIPQNRW